VLSWNIQGIGKKLEMQEIRQLIEGNDIIFLYETMKLDSYQPSFDGYYYFHCQRKFQHPRARRPAGGIAVFIRNELFTSKIVSIVKAREHAIWLKIVSRRHKEMYLGGLYIPPQRSSIYVNDSNYSTNNIHNEIRQDIALYLSKTPYVSICGDLNSRTGTVSDVEMNISGRNSNIVDDVDNAVAHIVGVDQMWPNHQRQSKDKTVNDYGRELLELCKAGNMRIMNGFFNCDETKDYTCHAPLGQSVVDYLVCSRSAFGILQSFNIVPKLVESDHKPLKFSFSIPSYDTAFTHRQNVMTQPRNMIFKYIFDKDKLDEYLANYDRNEAQSTLFDLTCDIENDMSTDTVVDKVYKYVNGSIENTFSKKKPRSFSCTFPVNKWFDDECKDLRKTVNSFAKSNDLSVAVSKTEYGILCRKYKQTIQRKQRHFQQVNRENLEKLLGSSQAECWKFWKKMTQLGTNQSNAPDLYTFHEYFTKQSHPPPIDYFDNEHMENIANVLHLSEYTCNDPVSREICDGIITEEEVTLHFRKLKNNKAAGIDGIPAEFYKYACEKLILPFCAVFNYIFDRGEYPSQRCEGLISALHKKGDKSNPDNYRKITVNVVMAKIFDSILNARLYYKNEALRLDDPCQFGFTPGASTTDCVFILDTTIRYQRHKRRPLYLCFVDFTKAFDYINRNALYYKLQKKCIGEKMLNVIMSMYSKAKARVNHLGNVGDSIDSSYGVLQGGILSPKLFNEFLSDLPNYLNASDGIDMGDLTLTHISYADDIVLLAHSETSLQNSINSLHDFCKKWHLIVNVAKTKVMHFGGSVQQFRYNDQDIESVDSFKYLGHVLTSKRNMHKEMTDYLVTQAQKALFALQGNTKQMLGYVTPLLSLKMFDTYILPILEYNCEIWGNNKPIPELEKIQLGYLKTMLGVRKQTPSLAVYGETGRFPLHVRQQTRMINYWVRLEKYPSSNILKKCLSIQKDLHNSGRDSWYGKINNIVNAHYTNMDQTQLSDSDLNLINRTYKSKIFQKSQETILSDINDSERQPKLRTYKLIKTDYRLEPYLLLPLNRKMYCQIARFRTSSHSLRIETGRHENPIIPAEERLCLKCDMNDVEDEMHCLVVCPSNSIHRVVLFNTATEYIENFERLDNENRFKTIMNAREPELLKAIGIFLTNVNA